MKTGEQDQGKVIPKSLTMNIMQDSEAEDFIIEFSKIVLAATCRMHERWQAEARRPVGNVQGRTKLEHGHNSAKFFATL